MTFRNRIVCSAHGTNFADQEHLPTERQVHYYAERAKGGVGLIILGGTVVHQSTLAGPGRILISDDRVIPLYERITDAVHEHGAKIFSQLAHHGRQMRGVYQRRPLWSASALPCSLNREIPKAMEIEDIEELVQSLTHAGRNAKEGGFDGVELYAAHGYLLGQFLSPHSNKRTDEYGGSLDNRMRLPLRAIDAVRQAVGKDFVVGMRLNADDFTPGGLTLDDTGEIARRFEATGKLDYLSVSAGTYHGGSLRIANMSYPPGIFESLAASIRESVQGIPVVCVNRINDPVLAERILADGHADLIAMARALICDPELPNKAKEGRLEDIRPCVACNQGCIAQVIAAGRLRCIQNAAVGEEKTMGIGTLQPASQRKRVMVVGGGPAGMEAARVAALRGHQVSLFEKDQELGGQINLAAKPAVRQELAGIVRFLKGQVEKLGVQVSLGVEMSADRILRMSPDAVVIATGSVPCKTGFTSARPDAQGIPGVEQKNVATVWQILREELEVGDKVVIIDDDPHLQAIYTAEFLADRGKKVEILTRLGGIVGDVDPFSAGAELKRLVKKGISYAAYTAVKEISGNTVIAYNTLTEEERRINDVDTIVLAMGNRADDTLYWDLKGRVKELHRVGDCVAPRKVMDAIWEGHNVGRVL